MKTKCRLRWISANEKIRLDCLNANYRYLKSQRDVSTVSARHGVAWHSTMSVPQPGRYFSGGKQSGYFNPLGGCSKGVEGQPRLAPIDAILVDLQVAHTTPRHCHGHPTSIRHSTIYQCLPLLIGILLPFFFTRHFLFFDPMVFLS